MKVSRRMLAATLALMLWPAWSLAQDAVKIGGFWINDVAVQGFTEGQIVYFAPGGGEVNQPLDKLEGIKLGKYPAMGAASEAIEAGNDAEALKQLTALRGNAKEPWLQRYVNKLLMETADRAGRADVAADAFIALVATPSLDPYYIANPPTASVGAADAKTRDAIRQRLDAVAARVPKQGEAQQAFAAMQALVAAAPAPAATGDAAEPDRPPAAPGTPGTAAAPPAGAATSAVVLPSFIEDNDITKLLRAGQFAEADAAVTAALQSAGDMSLKLYQHGMAKLGLADAAADDEAGQKLYKDAGLSFMRVLVHFPSSRYKGPAMVEAGYVHHKIGRDDQARKLYQGADLSLGDETEESAYFTRLRELNAQLAQ